MQPDQIAQHALAQYARAYAAAGSYEQARTAHNASSDGVLYIERAWAAMIAEDTALAASGASSFEAMVRGEDVARFEAMQEAQGLAKVVGTDGVAQWVPKAEARRMALVALYAPKFANLDPHSVAEKAELEREFNAAMVAIDG